MKTMTKKIIAGALASVVLVSTCHYADGNVDKTTMLLSEQTKVQSNTENATENNETIEKKETVFVNLDANGSVLEAIDSTWLKNSGNYNTVDDKSTLTSILPASKATLQTDKNGNMHWLTNGSDVYYQSRTSASLPVDVTIKYYLDGKLISPEKLAGKSGKLKIRIDYKNMTEGDDIKTPFTAVTVVPLDADVFSNVKINDGKIFSDGNMQMAIFIGFPSLESMLKLDEESIDTLNTLHFNDAFELTADVVDFELSTIGIALSPEIPSAIKNMTDTEKIADDLSDIQRIKNAKKSFESADTNHKLRNFIRDGGKIDQARLLLDDLYTFYGLNTSIIEELPKFVTDSNIALIERIKADIDAYNLKSVADNKVIRSIPNRFTDDNIKRVKKLLFWHDVFKNFDENKLDGIESVLDDREELIDFFDEVQDVIDDVRAHQDEIDTLEDIAEFKDEAENLIDKLESAKLTNQLSDSDIECMLEALAEKKTKEIMAGYADYVPTDGRLDAKMKLTLKGLIAQAVAAGEVDTATAAMITGIIEGGQLPPKLCQQLKELLKNGGMMEDVSVSTTSDGSIKITDAQIQQQQMAAKLGVKIVNLLQEKINYKVTATLEDTLKEGKSYLNDIKDFQKNVEDALGEDYVWDIRHSLSYLDSLKNQLDHLDNREKALDDKIQNANDVFHNEEDINYLELWKEKAKEMRKDVDANDDNVEIMRDLLNEYDSDEKLRNLYQHIDVLLDDFDEVRPIAEAFDDMLDKPQNKAQYFAMPNTLSTLINLRKDILNNRDITDTLSLATQDKVINAAVELLDLADDADEDNKLDNIENQLKSAQNIIDKKNKLIDRSESYDNFAGKTDDMNSSVKFVLKTAPIEIPVDEVDFEYHEEPAPSFIEWIGSFFH